MMIVHIATGEPVSVEAFRAAHPNVMFPEQLEPEHIEPFGYALVQPTDPPEAGPFDQIIEAPPVNVAGTWRQQWEVIPGHPPVDAVLWERARRLAGGFDYDFGDERGVVRIGTDPQDMAGWDDVTKLSNALLALGQPDATLAIVPESTPITITAMEWQQILVAAAAFRQPIWAASFVLQGMEPIPQDYDDDRWWGVWG